MGNRTIMMFQNRELETVSSPSISQIIRPQIAPVYRTLTSRYCAKCQRDLKSSILQTILRDKHYHLHFSDKKRKTDVNRLAYGHSTKKKWQSQAGSWDLLDTNTQALTTYTNLAQTVKAQDPPTSALVCIIYYRQLSEQFCSSNRRIAELCRDIND